MGIESKPAQNWHLKQAMALAGQLPDNEEDARIIVEAVFYLLDNYMSKARPSEPIRAANILPFTA
jgi:hypothetical protein